MKKIYIILGLLCKFTCIYSKGSSIDTGIASFSLSSPAFTPNSMIPEKYTCDGINISPELRWVNPPRGTKSFALIVDDPDADEKNWAHWAIFNISPRVTTLSEGIESRDFISAQNDFYYMKNGIWRYCGPCPPQGVHHYHFTLYALDIMLDLAPDTTVENLRIALKDHVLDKANLIGLYKRKKVHK